MRGPREVVSSLAQVTGASRARNHRRRLASLEVAVAENARLATLLERQVEQIESSLVPLLEADQRARPASGAEASG